MLTGSIPIATIWGTWSENVEVWDVETDTLMDLTHVTEITLMLRDPFTGTTELSTTMSAGNIVIPSMGIIQWRIEVGTMSTLLPRLYEILLLLDGDGDRTSLFMGPVSIVE